MATPPPPPVWLQYLTVIIAFSAFFVSALALFLQRWDKRPHLNITVETYVPTIRSGQDRTDTFSKVHSYWIANKGSVAVYIADMQLYPEQAFQIKKDVPNLHERYWKQLKRSLLKKRQSQKAVLLPLIKEDVVEKGRLKEALKRGHVKLPHKLEPGESIRLTA